MPDPDPSATVIVMRPGAPFQVLMVQRNSHGFFGGLIVFPGGSVDEVDVPAGLQAGDEVSHRTAALRELAEEVGILVTTRGALPAPPAKGFRFYQQVIQGGIELAIDDLVLVSRWVTPEGAPRRFDTRFYLLRCDDPPRVKVDREELVDHSWVTPAEALQRHDQGDWRMFLPTLAHLRWLARRSSIGDALQSARGADGRTLVQPQRLEDGSLLPIHMPTEEA